MLGPFPLLHCPQLVFSIIVNSTDLPEFVALALCSKKMFELAKKYKKQSKKLEIVMRSFDLQAVVYCNEQRLIFRSIFAFEQFFENPLQVWERGKISGHLVGIYKISEDHWNVMWTEDRVIGFQILMKWLSDLFGVEISIVAFDKHSLWTIEWIKTQQNGLIRAEFHGENEFISGNEYKEVLEKCNAERLAIVTSPPDSFQQLNSLRSRRSLLLKGPSFWFTLDHLLSMDFVELRVSKSLLTSKDINIFLKYWLAGGSTRLKWLCISLKSFEWVEITGDLLEKTYKDKDKDVRYVFDDGTSLGMFAAGVLYLPRNDGVIATLSQCESLFIMAVWPNKESINVTDRILIL